MAQAKAEALLSRLRRGEDCEEDARAFLELVTPIPDALVLASIGNRAGGVKPCPKALQVLLEGRANPNAIDAATQGPAMHSACWHGSIDVVRVLLDFRADIEAPEQRMKTPPLNTALAAGNAKVCLELLNRNADVQWAHHDGATALHVATAWISSTHNAQLRMPPVGEEPRAVIAMMLHNGVDPTQTEGMTRGATRGTGMTPLESFRRQIQMSPWRNDSSIGAQFDKTAKVIDLLLEQGTEAVKRKNLGNKAFSERRFEDALKLYIEARKVWEAAAVRGHHSAVLRSNEATCYKKLEDWENCQHACQQGLEHYCTAKIRKKLEECLAEAEKEFAEKAAGKSARVRGDLGSWAACPRAAPAVCRLAPAVKESPPAPAVPRKPATKLKEGFIDDALSAKPLYGEDGSVQGKVVNPGPFICHFEDAKEAGFVDGVDGWKDRQKRDEQALDQDLVQEGLMSPDLLDDPKTVEYINPLPPGVG